MIFDTDVLIDLSRKHPPALEWLASQGVPPILSGIAAIEVAYGARDAVALRSAKQLIANFVVEWQIAADLRKAYDLAELHLSNGIEVPDAITAAIGLRLNLLVATFNVKHFRAVSGLALVRPYDR
ncbi:MAG TPA: PIN domain-containing protein [Capsulimonadaceae bacterium]|jgi:predicted nucleic acid-binding protein